jgi:Fic family protein
MNKLPPKFNFQTPKIYDALIKAHINLAELKGLAQTIPNQQILINTLALQEAKDSSEIENIVTTQDELYRFDLDNNLFASAHAKEVKDYKNALLTGFKLIKQKKLIDNNTLLSIHQVLEHNKAGYRNLPGTVLKNNNNEVVYTPPQDKETILNFINDLFEYINLEDMHEVDPLIKAGIIHLQFESIHPFYDGNGRVGRILIILYLVLNDYLDIPILYLSAYITKNKSQYYKLLQSVRDNDNWEEWTLFMLKGIEETSSNTSIKIIKIKELMLDYKNLLRDNFSFYSQDLINNLFNHPYTKIEFLESDLGISRQTSSKYLTEISTKFPNKLKKVKVGKFSYFVNVDLVELLSNG